MAPKITKKSPAATGVKKAGAKTPTPKTPAKTAKAEAGADEKEQAVTPVDAPKVEEKPSETTVQIVTKTAEKASKDAVDTNIEKEAGASIVIESTVDGEASKSTNVDGEASKPVDVDGKASKQVPGDEQASKDEGVKGDELGVKEADVAKQEAQLNEGKVEGTTQERDEGDNAEGGEGKGGGEYEELLIGQGEEGHPQDVEMPAPVKERRKQKEFEVFVGGLDKDANEEDLKNVFGEVGEIVEVRLAKNPHTKKNKGFAFIRYKTIEQAKKAVAELKNPQVKGKRCGVTRSQDNETLYVRNICRTWTKDTLRDKLKDYGIENVEELTLVDDPQKEGMNRGFAFLEFNTHLDATNAFKRLQKRDVFFGVDVSAKVAFAKSGIEPDEEVMSQVKSVFVDGLPVAWDEEQVQENFKKYGEIEKVQLARNMPSAKRRDFGFINFTTREAALACIEGVNKNELVKGDNKVIMKATLRKPQQKGRSVKDGAPGGYQTGYTGSRGSRVPWSRGAGVQYGGRFDARGGREFLREREYYQDHRDLPARSRHLQSSGRIYDRRPSAPESLRSSHRRDYGEENELPIQRQSRTSSRSAAAIPKRAIYMDEYGYDADYYSESMTQSHSRIPSRRAAYAEDVYSHQMDETLAYHEAPAHNYDAASGTKRPYSTLDQELPYAGPSARRPRSHLNLGAGPIGGSRAGGVEGGSYPNVYSGRNAGGYGSRSGPGPYY